MHKCWKWRRKKLSTPGTETNSGVPSHGVRQTIVVLSATVWIKSEGNKQGPAELIRKQENEKLIRKRKKQTTLSIHETDRPCPCASLSGREQQNRRQNY